MPSDVEDELMEQAVQAIEKGASPIWLYWPYVNPDDGDVIYSVLLDVEDELKWSPRVRASTRQSVVPTRVWHAPEGQAAGLYIRG